MHKIIQSLSDFVIAAVRTPKKGRGNSFEQSCSPGNFLSNFFSSPSSRVRFRIRGPPFSDLAGSDRSIRLGRGNGAASPDTLASLNGHSTS
ncbi:hypothetical protein B5X24_HaOG211699 [Helicoverpa armigera]|nr:hypothetical protein B5X24_HaOG211699 [Helicoverpa armigera]